MFVRHFDALAQELIALGIMQNGKGWSGDIDVSRVYNCHETFQEINAENINDGAPSNISDGGIQFHLSFYSRQMT